MAFFTIPYRVLFHDTMAYGTHHHMTNFKFQNQAREILLFETKVEGKESWKDQLENTIMLTREAHSLNLAPVELGGKVAILLSYEEPSRSTVRLCFRVIGQDGTPVSCGYQTMLLIDKESYAPIPAPSMITQYLNPGDEKNLIEKLNSPSFKDRVLEGGIHLKSIFSEEVLELGKFIANQNIQDSRPTIIDELKNNYPLGSFSKIDSEFKKLGNGIVFTFPGQGSYHYSVLKELFQNYPEGRELFEKAESLTTKLLGKSFLQLLETDSQIEHDKILAEFPDLNQVGIFLTEVLIAQGILANGIKPDILLGHSFGEIAALAVSNAITIEEGIAIICYRVKALHQVETSGRMGAIYAGVKETIALLQEFGDNNLEIAVVNHPKQVVISGYINQLEQFRDFLASKGIALTIIDSNYPFHSHYLKQGVSIFRDSLRKYTFKAAEIPVYQNTERQLYTPGNHNGKVLADQFIKTLDFQGIVLQFYNNGFRNFIECGAGDIVTKLVQKNLKGKEGVHTIPTFLPGKQLFEAQQEVMTSLLSHPLAEKMVKEVLKDSFSEKTVKSSMPNQNKKIDKEIEKSKEKCMDMPVAIVGMGCVLPGAENPQEFWKNMVDGKSGIVNLTEVDPNTRKDFVAGDVSEKLDIVPDKTYTLLNGTITTILYDKKLLGKYYSEKDFQLLTRGQKLLVSALAQCFGEYKFKNRKSERTQFLIGATADGSSEYDEASFLESVFSSIKNIKGSLEEKSIFSEGIKQILGYSPGDAEKLKQHPIYNEVAKKFLGSEVNAILIDSACSSSLYSINLGMKALQTRESDIIFAGGVFAPGPANNTLFAQFRGLTPNGSRPLDKSADGVIFGDGGAILAMKRLDDAIADKDQIIGVIRGMGLSSDGSSPSINVPQVKGQSIAVEKAYKNLGISVNTIQFVEAHATSTPVGDATEFKSLSLAMYGRSSELPKIHLGSVKSLIGHTGWVSGVASIIKILLSFENQTIPKQFHFEAPNEGIDLANSPFTIPKESVFWSKNINGLPRRAGINGFGFGGTNAHVVLEEFDTHYHPQLLENFEENQLNKELAIIGIGSLFPSKEKLETTIPENQSIFDRTKLRLPAKKLLLPDITDSMDITQFLAALGAEQIFNQIPDWKKHKDSIGVVMGLESKTESGIAANERIYRDQLKRKVEEEKHKIPLSSNEVSRILNQLIAELEKANMPSGPYTLPGLMPNVTASRITHMFNLHGPNMVVDKAEDSLFQSIKVAEQFLLHEDCKIVLAGGINAPNDKIKVENSEGALILALATSEVARKESFEILGLLNISSKEANDNPPKVTFNRRGAQGAENILDILTKFKAGKPQNTFLEESLNSFSNFKFHFKNKLEKGSVTDRTQKPGTVPHYLKETYNYVSGTPVYALTPFLVTEAAKKGSVTLEGKKILFVIDEEAHWKKLESSGIIAGLDYKVLSPEKPGASSEYFHIDLSDDKAIAKAVPLSSFDIIIAHKNIGNKAQNVLTEDNRINFQLTDLLFVICRELYEEISMGKIKLVSICTNAWVGKVLHPITSTVAGFMKSVSRELPDGCIKTINTDENNFLVALRQVEIELFQPLYIGEISYKNGVRKVFKLKELATLSKGQRPMINKNSVVIATGGGRGVTATLIEKLAEEYGCTIIAVGRTNLENIPRELLEMEETEFKAFETKFYQQELSKGKGKTIKELKALYGFYQAGNELYHTIKTMKSLPGNFEYVAMNILDESEVSNLVNLVTEKYGKIDWVIHGAGVQISGVLAKKSIADFRKVIDTKTASLGHIYRAITATNPRTAVNYHILTSTFSYMGNDGQPDYGAANEYLNRLAENMNGNKKANWSSMAWLGWAGIGMTRGSEYAALAANRRLRGITKEEGQEIFSKLIKRKPVTPINITMADGEVAYYNVQLENPPKHRVDIQVGQRIAESKKIKLIRPYEIDLEKAPYLYDHVVAGIPTLPAAFITSIVAETAKELRPKLYVTNFLDTYFHKFIRVFPGKSCNLRVVVEVLEESGESASLKVKVLSDFIHKSGKILKKDILHNETTLKMSSQKPVPLKKESLDYEHFSGLELPDPYVIPSSEVQLKGHFNSTSLIKISSIERRAIYALKQLEHPDATYNYLVPNLTLVDAFWRFGTVNLNKNDMLSVYVPEKCADMKIYFDFTDFSLHSLKQKLLFGGANPIENGELLKVGPIDVRDENGNVILEVIGGVCRKFGEVLNMENMKNLMHSKNGENISTL